jgi:hypothetical protein
MIKVEVKYMNKEEYKEAVSKYPTSKMVQPPVGGSTPKEISPENDSVYLARGDIKTP